MKIYLLIEDCGQYEDAYRHIRGIYSKKESAEKLKKEYEDEKTRLLSMSQPSENYEKLSEWWNNRWYLEDINYWDIEEHDLIDE